MTRCETSPTSVARGLQRVGRAGHQVGAPSKGVIFPKYRGDLLEAAVVTRRMHEGAIEATAIPRNPLDVLAQQIVAMTVMDPWTVDEILAAVNRAETLLWDWWGPDPGPFGAMTDAVRELFDEAALLTGDEVPFAAARERFTARDDLRPPRTVVTWGLYHGPVEVTLRPLSG